MAVHSNNKENDVPPTKYFVYIVAFVIIVFVILLGSVYFFANFTPKDIYELHKENIMNKPGKDNYVYNGFSFLRRPEQYTNTSFWHTFYFEDNKEYPMELQYGPREVEDILYYLIDSGNITRYNSTLTAIIYITIDPLNDSAKRPYTAQSVYEISEKLKKIKNMEFVTACTVNDSICASRPIINCSNTNNTVIYLKDYSDIVKTQVVIEKNCFTIYGKNEEILRASDSFILHILGIMPFKFFKIS